MFSRVFKNHNVTVRRDSLDEGVNVRGVEHFIELIHNDFDAPDVAYIPGIDVISPCAYGNSGGGYEVALNTQDGPYWYLIDDGDVDMFNAGKTVRLYAREAAPLFVLPTFHGSSDVVRESDGVKGVVYKFGHCSYDETPDDETWDAMEAAGCDRLTWRTQYAPEIGGDAVFIPYSVPFQFG